MSTPQPMSHAHSICVLLQPLRAGLVVGQDNAVDVLVRVQAPDGPSIPSDGQSAGRAPQALALVLDRSGSMAGQPLIEAVRCAHMVVDRLRPTDCVSLVEFDDRVSRLWPAVPRGDGEALRGRLNRIRAGGSTNLHGGWREGADTLIGVDGTGLKRVILLSDGCANRGLADQQAIVAQCAAMAERGITTSTYGLGQKFNEDLMLAIARAGAGNSYYGDTAEDLMEPFMRELDLLGDLCLRDVHLAFNTTDGATGAMLNDLSMSRFGWRLTDLAWGAEAWAVVRVQVPNRLVRSTGALVSVLSVKITGLDVDGTLIELEPVGMSLPVVDASQWSRLPEDALVARRLAEIEASAVMRQMRSAAEEHDWALVDYLLDDAQLRFRRSEWVASVLESMKLIAASRSRERLRKEALYSAVNMNVRLSRKDEGLRFFIHAESNSGPSYLRRKASQGNGWA